MLPVCWIVYITLHYFTVLYSAKMFRNDRLTAQGNSDFLVSDGPAAVAGSMRLCSRCGHAIT
jgi:hypothetical protein